MFLRRVGLPWAFLSNAQSSTAALASVIFPPNSIDDYSKSPSNFQQQQQPPPSSFLTISDFCNASQIFGQQTIVTRKPYRQCSVLPLVHLQSSVCVHPKKCSNSHKIAHFSSTRHYSSSTSGKDKVPSSNVSSSDSGGTGSGSNTLVVTIKDGLSNRESADDFLGQLNDQQKQLIYHTLNIEILRDKYEGTLASSRLESHHYLSRFGRPATQKEDPTGTLCELDGRWLHHKLDEKAPPASASAIWAVIVKNAMPFIGFGFLDNLIMILAGDYIDITIGTALGISTMAAAALGNTISDVAGIGSAWYVEELASKVGIKDPDLTPSQMASGAVRWAANFGRAFGVMLGCLLGMFPLLFLPSAEEAKERREGKEDKEEDKKEGKGAVSGDKSKFA